MNTIPQEPQQSSLYASYMKALHWTVVKVNGSQLFVRTFPFRQGMMKIHRPEVIPSIPKLLPILKHYSVKTLVIEPVRTQDEQQLMAWISKLPSYVTVSSTPFLPTKTIQVNLEPDETEIFSAFSEAKRRAVRRAGKLGVIVTESEHMNDLIRIKNKSAGFLGFITTAGMKPLWPVFAPDNASILLAHDNKNTLIGGVLLLHWDSVTYYWIAGATKHGKKLFAPTLLAWESMKLGKKKKSKRFDFVGVWDERIPGKNTEWKGFTKFKEGFGGTAFYYPLATKI